MSNERLREIQIYDNDKDWIVFANSNLSLQTWIHALYLWSERIGEKQASRQAGVSEKTMIDC